MTCTKWWGEQYREHDLTAIFNAYKSRIRKREEEKVYECVQGRRLNEQKLLVQFSLHIFTPYIIATLLFDCDKKENILI